MKKPLVKLTSLAVMLAFSGASAHAVAEDNDAKSEKLKLDAIAVQGILPERLEAVPGSFDIVDEKQIQEKRPFSIKEALSEVPGINIVQSEDPIGLALNIGIRGMDPRRTSRTLLMEDGVPLFLAPYGDPSARYATPLEMLDRIEVVKGSGQILYGPQTVGGMINFVTKPVPRNGFAGSITAAVGNNDYRSAHVSMGTGNERGGFMVDGLKRTGDGIRDNHKFDVEMFGVKGEVKLTDSQTLIAKVNRYEEKSNVSETGLGLLEYNEDKFQAPTGNKDKFFHERTAVHLKHIFDINPDAKLSTQTYYTYSNRASRRLLSSEEEDGGILSGRSIISSNGNPIGRATEARAEISDGAWRPRQYKVWGIEPRLDFKHTLFGLDSDAVIGFRYHEEDITRRKFEFEGGPLGLSDTIAFGEFDERIKSKVEAKSYYIQNTFYAGDWSITPGFRYEDYKIKQSVQDGTDPVVSGSKSNNELLPGLGLAWNGINNTTIFAGVHRGFAPPRPDRDIDTAGLDRTTAELSTNYELGFRSRYYKGINVSSTLFYTDFDDLVVKEGNGRFSNAGKAEMAGLEIAGRVDFGTIYDTPHNFYMTASYTNTFTAKLKSDISATGDFGGDANKGARLAYAPKHIASLNFGYSHPVGINARVGADYVSEQQPDLFTRINPTNEDGDPIGVESGLLGEIPSYTLLNASVNFKPVGSKVTYFANATNIADREYLASRVDGMAVGRGRQVFGGVRIDF